jgi:UDP-glucose 4-epimerase
VGIGFYQLETRLKVLITGAFGYLGGRLAQFLYDKNYLVYLGSRFAREAPNGLPKAKVILTHWGHQDELKRICRDIDIIIHLAGMNAHDCMHNPRGALEVNGAYTTRLVEAAIKQNVRRFIYLSTAHVYSGALAGPISEAMAPMNSHPYATSHLAGELAVLTAAEKKQMEGIVIRLSNTFGPPTDKNVNCWSLVVNEVCRQAVTTQKICLNSHGMQRRDFVNLSQVCHAIDFLLAAPAENLGNGLFNLGSGWAPRVWDMVCLIQQRCEAIFNFKPNVRRLNFNIVDEAVPLDYRMDHLKKLGFQSKSEPLLEIDKLLEFCQTIFL